MKKLIIIAMAILALHQSNTQTIDYIDNTEPVYGQSGNGHDGGDMNEVGTLYTSYNGHLFLADQASNYYEVYTDAEVYPTSDTQNFNPFDITLDKRMYRQKATEILNAQTFEDNLCDDPHCGYDDRTSFQTSWDNGWFGSNTIASDTSNEPSYLYRNWKRYATSDGGNPAKSGTIYWGALVRNIKTNGSGWYADRKSYSVKFDYYNPIYLKDQNQINIMNSSTFLLATQTDKGTVTLTSPTFSNIKYNSILKTATDDTFSSTGKVNGTTGSVYYITCAVSTTAITTSASASYQYIGAYVQNNITYYVYGTKLSNSTSNNVTTTAAQAFDSIQTSFSYLTT